MKRKLFLYGLLLAVLVVGIPYFTGQVAKHRFQQLAQALSYSEHGAVTVLSYESGWHKSKAKTRLTLTSGMLKSFLDELGEESLKVPENLFVNRPLRIVLEHEIEHGPFVKKAKGNWKDWLFVQAVIHSKLSISEDAKALLEQEIGEKDFISITTEIAMDNNISLSLQGKPISVTENNVEHSIWQGILGTWYFTDDLNRMTGKITIPGFYLETAGKEYSVEDLLLSYDTKRLSDTGTAEYPVFIKDNKLFANKITIRSQNKHMLILHSVVANSYSDKAQNEQFNLKIAMLEIDAHEYGGLQLDASLQKTNLKQFTGKGTLKGSAVLVPELAKYYSGIVGEEPSIASTPTNNSIAGLIEEGFKNKIVIDQNNQAMMSFEFVDGKSVLQ